MRSFTFVVVAVMFQLGTATAQDRPTRLSADVFVETSFPDDIIRAARHADAIALRIAKMRHEIELSLKEAEIVYDDALFRRPNISVVLLVSAFENYQAVLSEYWSVDQYLKGVDVIVESRYTAWAENGVEPSSALIFQRWREAAHANYVSVSSDEEKAYRLMLNIGIDRINRQLRRDKQKLGRYKAPRFRRIND